MKRQHILNYDASANPNERIEAETLQFLVRKTQHLSDAEFVLMLRRVSRFNDGLSLLMEHRLVRGEEL